MHGYDFFFDTNIAQNPMKWKFTPICYDYETILPMWPVKLTKERWQLSPLQKKTIV
jgi:hypothetical protein